MSVPETDLAIVGGGIAGALLARAAARRGLSTIVFDQPAAWRASEAPLAMLHPFPGRSLDRKPASLTAFAEAARTLRQALEERPDIGRQTIMLRPLDALQGERLRETLTTERGRLAAQGFDVEVHTTERLLAQHPSLSAATPEALVYGPAFAVQLGRLRRWALHVAQAGTAQLREEEVTSLHRWETGWQVRSAGGPLIMARQVVLAPGASLSSWFPDLGVKVAGGELVALTPADNPEIRPLISASGTYVGRLESTVYVGATRWPWSERHLRSDPDAGAALRERGALLVPDLAQAEIRNVWRGARAVLPRGRREPVIGVVPGHSGLAVVGALGGKGLLWSSRAAELALDALDGAPVPDLVDPAALQRRWGSPRLRVERNQGPW